MVLVFPLNLEHSFHIIANSTNYIKQGLSKRSEFEKYIFYFFQYLRKQIRKNYIYIPILNKEDINDLLTKLESYITIEKCNMNPSKIREYLFFDFNTIGKELILNDTTSNELKNILHKMIDYNIQQYNLVKLNDILFILLCMEDVYYIPEEVTLLIFNNFYFIIENDIDSPNFKNLLETKTFLVDINSNYLVLKIKVNYKAFLYYIFDYFLQKYRFNETNSENNTTIEKIKEKCEMFISNNSIKLNNKTEYCFEIAKLTDELNFKLNCIYYNIPHKDDYWMCLMEKEMILNYKTEKEVMTKLEYQGYKNEIIFDFYFDYNYLTSIHTFYLSII
jgi:hypothetical protein